MAKKIELLNDQQEVVHPLTSADCVIMENGETLDKVMGDGIATPTITHEGTSFQVGVGDSNIEVVDGDVAGMIIKGQSYQNILPKPTTLIMETDEKEFKINDKIDSNIIIDDNIAEIATVKGKTIVNAVQEESGSEYTVLGEDLSGQGEIVTENTVDGNLKGVTLQGQTLVNTIQEPCKDDYVVLGDAIEISAETGGHGTIEDTVGGSIKSAILKGNTLINKIKNPTDNSYQTTNRVVFAWDDNLKFGTVHCHDVANWNRDITIISTTGKPVRIEWLYDDDDGETVVWGGLVVTNVINEKVTLPSNCTSISISGYHSDGWTLDNVQQANVIILEGHHELTNILYFDGMQSVKMPVLTTTGKNLVKIKQNYSFTKNGITFSRIDDNAIKVVGELSQSEISAYLCDIDLSKTLENGKKYTALLFDSNGNVISNSNSGTLFAKFNIAKHDGTHIYTDNFTFDSSIHKQVYYYISTFMGTRTVDLVANVFVSQTDEQSTSYEPYKSNILTVNEDMTLRGIGDVKDTLDLLTGVMTERIVEIVLDGSDDENWNINENGNLFVIKGIDEGVYNYTNPLILTDKFNAISFVDTYNGVKDGVSFGASKADRLCFHKTGITTLEDWKLYIQENPITAQYLLATESVKTVDLTVLDQDNNTIPHIQTQPTVTHITASSACLIPTVTIDNNLAYETIIKPSTLYTVRFKHNTVNADNPLTVDLGGTVQTVTSTKFTITTPSTLTHNQLQFSGKGNVVSKVQVIEGDVTNIEYPYFEGMNSVGQTVLKNCLPSLLNFYKDDHTQKVNAWFGAGSGDFNYSVDDNGLLSMTMISTGSRVLRCDDLTKVKPNTKYLVKIKYTNSSSNTINFGYLDTDIVYHHLATEILSDTWFVVTTPSSDKMIGMWFGMLSNIQSGVKLTFKDIQMIEYQDGMENWNIPYFENKQKVSDIRMVVTGKNLVKHLPSSDYYGFTIVAAEGSSTIINGTLTTDYRDYYIVGTNENTHLIDYFAQMEVGKTIHFNSNAGNFIHYIAIGKPGVPTSYHLNKYTKKSDDEVLLSMFIRFTKDCSFNNQTLQIQVEEGSVPTSYEPRHEIIVQQDVDSIPLTSDMFEQGARERGMGFSMQQCPLTSNTARISSKTLIPVKPNSNYTVLGIDISVNHIWGDMYDKDGLVCYDSVLDLTGGISSGTGVFVPHDVHYLCIKIKNADESAISPSDLDSMNLVLQEVPQEIVLRGIGDVKDELDLTRGEYIQRIGEATITEYGNWSYGKPSSGWNQDGDAKAFYSYDVSKTLFSNKKLSGKCKCDKMCTIKGGSITTFLVNHDTFGLGHLDYVIIRKTGISTQEELKAWLQQNPITVQYELATPIIHKVNLTNTKIIPSYATETHYETITPSDSLIPNITIPSTLNYDVAIKPSTEYTIRANTSDNLTVDLGGATGTLSNGKVTLTTPATLTHNEVKFSGTGKVKELMVVEGNEIKDNVPFFNGMKDVQMGGIKLVNIARLQKCSALVTANTNKTQFTYTSDGSHWGDILFDKSLLKQNTLYTIYLNVISSNSDNENPIKISMGDDLNTWLNVSTTGLFKQTFTTNDNIENLFGINFRPCTSGQKVVIENTMIIEGDWTHLDEIPYVESEMIIEQPIIRSQGKNLFDISRGINYTWHAEYTINGDGSVSVIPTVVGGVSYVQSEPFVLEVGKTYTVSWNASGNTHANFVWLFGTTGSPYGTSNTFTVVEGKNKLTLAMYVDTSSLENVAIFKPQIEEGSTNTQYKAYRHQTLYSNRVIGYEDECYYAHDTGAKTSSPSINSVTSDVEGLSIAYVTHASSNFSFWDKDGAFISGSMFLSTATNSNANSNFDKDGFIVVPANAKYMKMACGNQNSGAAKDYHLKATVTGDLPLRSLPSGVCDTLNLVTGEYVQRVGEIVLDGSQKDEYWLYNDTNKTFRIQIVDAIQIANSLGDPLRNKILVSSDKLPSRKYSDDWNSGTFITVALDSRITLRIDGITTISNLQDYLKQNPITVQYELATPIVRKLEFTAKGNYREQVLDGSETWAMDAIDNIKTVRMTKKTTSPLQNPLYDTVLFTDDYHVRAKDENHNTYEYITCIGNGIYINIYQSKVNELSVKGCTQWLSHNPIKVGYITSTQSSESYSNIHKPIFFNNVDVQFLPNNVGIQPELTLQARTRNSYVIDMMKPNTTYTMKCLTYSNSAKLYVANSTTNTSVTSNKAFQIAENYLDRSKNELVLVGQWYEPMIIEGDVTGKNLPYFKGILSSYHDVDEVEIYSITKNLFNIHDVQIESDKWETIIDTEKCKITSKRVIEDNTGAFATRIVINNIKPSTRYCLRWVSDNGGMIYVYTTELWDSANQLTATHGSDGKAIFYTPANTDKIVMGLNYGDTNGLSGKDYRTLSDIVLYEIGVNEEITEKPTYIPHAHNTTLIEMPTRLETVKIVRPVLEKGVINTGTGASYDDGDALVRNVRTKDYLPVQPGEIIKFYNNGQGRAVNIHYYDINKQFIKYEFYDGISTRPTVPKDCYFVRMYCGKSACSDITLTRQAYKPIQLNSLPNDVYDEIIMKPNNNKAQLVQRVGKVVLDGSESWKQNATVLYFCFNSTTSNHKSRSNGGMAISRLKYLIGQEVLANNTDGFSMGGSEFIQLCDMQCNTVTELINKLRSNPLIVYYELATPVIHEIQLQGYPHVYEDGTVTLNTDIPHQTLISYNVNQEQLINTQNETIIRHDQQIDDLYYYIELYLEEIYQMELFRMQVELSL